MARWVGGVGQEDNGIEKYLEGKMIEFGNGSYKVGAGG